MSIHPTAVISQKAKLGTNVSVGPYAVIEDNVKVGANSEVGPHAVIMQYAQMGEDNLVHKGAVIGHHPQDLKFDPHCKSYLKIGNGNVFREYCTVHRGTEPESSTIIGNNNYFMGFSHVAHNCRIGNNVILCNGAIAAGHVQVDDKAFISGYVLIHQYVHVGRLAMFSGGARVSKDVPPFMMACERNEIWSLNLVGLERAGIEDDEIKKLKKLYRIFYRSGLNVKQALAQIEKQTIDSPLVDEFVHFVKKSRNGVLPHKK